MNVSGHPAVSESEIKRRFQHCAGAEHRWPFDPLIPPPTLSLENSSLDFVYLADYNLDYAFAV